MNTIIEFIKKNYKYLIALALLFLVSFLIYNFASAADDEFADKIKIENASVTIQDGTLPFDSDDTAGNDSSAGNKVVRNFDSIKYTINYNLAFKDTSTMGNPSGRFVTVDVALPSNLDVKISSGLDSETAASKVSDENNITHYQLDYSNASYGTENTLNIYIKQINSSNGTKITPTIKIKEKTDTTEFNSITALNVDSVTVSAKDRLSIKLYEGTMKKDSGDTTIPIGLLLYIPNEGEKGIKGASIPSSFNADLEISKDRETDIRVFETVNYDEKSYTVQNLPVSYTNNNGNLGYESNGDTIKLKYTNLKYNSNQVNLNEGVEESEENSVTYISTKVISLISTKKGNQDVTLTFKAKQNGSELSTLSVIDNYEKFVGKYLSKIDFIDESNITVGANEDIKFTDPGKASYNYNENFYIQDTITYTSGDTLENGLTNYIKVDNDIIKLVDVGNISDETKDYYAEMTSSDEKQNITNPDFEVKYGVGTWTPSNFQVKSNKPSYCPSSVTNLTKDQLMNYYGGPCIEEKANSITWYDSISEVIDANNGEIMLFKFDFKEDYYPGTTTTIRLRGQVKSDLNIINETAAVMSRAETVFKDSAYYLSEVEYKSVSEQSSDLNYAKTVYNKDTKEITSEDSPSNKYGNTLLVTPFRSQIDDIVVKDNNDSEKTTIYSGLNDPISINITPILYKSDMNATFTKATVAVYLPVELELSIEKGDKTPISTNKTQDGLYNELIYEYTEDEIKYGDQGGIIPKLVLHAYVDISLSSEKNVTVKSIVDATLKPNIDAVTTYNSNTPVSYRTNTKDLTLMNTKIIGTLGKVTPTYFERNQVMTYNMRVSNISGEDANLEIIKILPYTGDSISDGSDFKGALSVKLAENLPTGYNVYYTKDSSKTIINNELSQTNSNKWTLWTNYTTDITGVTAIKITTDKNTTIPNASYFASPNGINLIMTTSGNEEGDEYYNNFYVIHHHTVNCDPGIEGGCPDTPQDKVPYASNISYSSVYNRQISGFAFEDYNYDGIYGTGENKLSDIVVELYKLSKDDFEKNTPLQAISENDKKVSDTVTDKNGNYKFKGLEQGNYYVKYTFDCDKYTVTNKNKVDDTLGDLTENDSDADMVAGTCSAISNIVTVNNDNIKQEYINLGLRIRQNFDVNIKKYITNVIVNSNRGTQSYDYNNETKVKIDVKNLKNTSFRVTYKFEIENSKYFPGTIGSIIETIPDGMTFDPSIPENDGWYESGGFLYYNNYAITYILPDEKYYMSIVLDLKTDSGGDFVNFVAAQDLKIMETTANLLEGIQITNYDPSLDKPIEEETE